jgi:hypothetical protein
VEGVCMVTRWAHHRGKTRALGTLGMTVLGCDSLLVFMPLRTLSLAMASTNRSGSEGRGGVLRIPITLSFAWAGIGGRVQVRQRNSGWQRE